MDKYDEIAADIVDIVVEKIEELYPELKPKQEFLDESENASILFGEAYYDVECQISDMLKERFITKEEKGAVINEWPESQICIGCKHATFIPKGHGSSAYMCEKNCDASSECCDENRVEATDEEWHAKF